MARIMIVVSTFYFVIGILMGVGMSISDNHMLSSVHVHINLLGWVSMALGGILYHMFPAAANSRLSKWHLWTHMIGIPLMMIGLACLLLTDNEMFVTPISIGAVLIVIGTIMFSTNAVRHMR